MEERNTVRDHVVWLLEGGQAHVGFEEVVEAVPAEGRGERPGAMPYSPWELLEHMRLCQWDILRFATDRDHVSPDWPGGFWPEGPAPPDERAWRRSVERFLADRAELRDLVADPVTDPLAELPWAPGYTALRQALLAADHNAYHVGQMVMLCRLLGAWE